MVTDIIIDVKWVLLSFQLNWWQRMLRISWARNNSSPAKRRFLCTLNWFVKLSNICTLLVFNCCWIESVSGIIEENLLFFLCNSRTSSPIDIVHDNSLWYLVGIFFSNQRMAWSLGE